MNRKRLTIWVLVVLMIALSGAGLLVVSRSGAEKTINSAIDQLRSSDESERFAAKEWICLQGETAVGPIYDLLNESLAIPLVRPHFLFGKEAEGNRLWEQLNDSTRSRQDSSRRDIVVQKQELMESLSKIGISGRLRDDCIELLGRLRSERAIPLLITLTRLDYEGLPGPGPYIRPEMQALIQIGQPAIPELLAAFASSTNTTENTSINSAKRSSDQNGVHTITEDYAFQSRLIVVLGEIGDERALPLLQQFLESIKGPNDARVVFTEDAIKEIRSTK